MGLFKEYWGNVYERAHKRTKGWIGLRGIIIEAGIGLAVSYFLLKPKKCSDIGWREIMITAGIIIGLYVLVVIAHIFKEPPLMDKEKSDDLHASKKKIVELEKRISRKNIKPYPDPTYYVKSYKYVYGVVMVENDSGKALNNYFNRIEQVCFLDAGVEKELPFPSNIEFRWPGPPGMAISEMKPIASKNRVKISIVNTHDSFFKLDTIQSVKSDFNKFEEKGIYKIVFLVGGTIGENDITNLFQVRIDYKGGNEIEIIDFKESNDGK